MTRLDLPHVYLATLRAVAGLLLGAVLDRSGEPPADLLLEAKAPWPPNTAAPALGDATAIRRAGVG